MKVKESYIKQSLGFDAFKITISKVIALMISFLVTMLLSRFRSLEEYGTYSQLLMIVNLITALMMLGLPNSINYFLARIEDEQDRAKFLSVYYSLNTTLSFFIGLLLVVFNPVIVNYFNNPYIKDFIYVLAIYPGARIIISSIENVLVVYRKTSIILVYRIAHSIALLLIIVLVQLLGLKFTSYMTLFVIVETIFSISVYIIVKNISGKLQFIFDKHLIKSILKFSIPIGLASVVGTLNIELDKFLIARFFNTEQLAIYTNASREMPVTIVATSLTAVLLPQIVKMLKNNQDDEAITLWGNATILSYLIICLLASGFFVFAPDIITLFYSDKYLPGVSVFRVYNIVLLLRCTYFGMILNAKGKTKFIFYSSIISLLLNVCMNFVFYSIFGFIGPAIATFLSQLIINIIQLIFTSKIMKINFKKIFPWGKVGYITAFNVIIGFIFYNVKRIIGLNYYIGDLFESILLGFLWGGIYLMVFKKEIKVNWKTLNSK